MKATLLAAPLGLAPCPSSGSIGSNRADGGRRGSVGQELDARVLNDVVQRLRESGAALRDLPVGDRIEGLANTAATLLASLSETTPSSSGESSALVEDLAGGTGYSTPVVRQGLADLWGAITAPELARWWSRAGGEPTGKLAVVIAAGNIPGVPVFPIVAGLLAGIPLLIKVSGDEPLVAAHWHDALGRVAPRLAESLAVAFWSGGDVALEDVACGAADRVLVLGSDGTVATLEGRYGARVAGFGTGLSLAIVTPGADIRRAAEGIARDLAVWDQQGCLSPRGVFVVGDAAGAVAFGHALRRELEIVTVTLPPGRRTPAEAAGVRHFRADQEARSAAGAGAQLWTSGPTLDWTLSVEPGAGFEPSCLGRTLRIWPLTDPRTLEQELAPWRRQLQGVALAADPADAGAWGERLLGIGFSHVTEPGRLQSPPVHWRNRGRDLLRVLLDPVT